jgi:hypothetical protein
MKVEGALKSVVSTVHRLYNNSPPQNGPLSSPFVGIRAGQLYTIRLTKVSVTLVAGSAQRSSGFVECGQAGRVIESDGQQAVFIRVG